MARIFASVTTVSARGGTVVTHSDFSFPITVDFTYPVTDSLFGETVSTTQDYSLNQSIMHNGSLNVFSSVNDSGKATDTSPAMSTQEYTTYNSSGRFYDCHITSKNNTLTNVSQGCKPNQH